MNLTLKNGLHKIAPDRRDHSLIPTFGATPFDVQGLPENFSNYDGREIPNQNSLDSRFSPPIPPLPFGCTGETGTFDSGIQDSSVYRPDIPYLGTKPFTKDTGREMRDSLATLKRKAMLLTQQGEAGPVRTEYFNCYGSSKISDFNAARIALWINQNEKRGVWVGSFWYPEFSHPQDGILPTPSFDTEMASLHCWLITGWKTIAGKLYLEGVSWQGKDYGDKGLHYLSEELYDALMQQPYTGAFTITKVTGLTPISVGYKAVIDHLVYFIMNLFNIKPSVQPEPPKPVEPPPLHIPIDEPPKYQWATKEYAKHSVRVICDEEGLTLEQKNTMTATVAAESGFNTLAVNYNRRADGSVASTDYGICQWNDYYHGKEISPDEALHNPEKAVRLMCSYWKRNQRSLWIGYSSGNYKRYL